MDTISPWASQIEEKKPFFLDFSEQETIKKIYNEIEHSIFQHQRAIDLAKIHYMIPAYRY